MTKGKKAFRILISTLLILIALVLVLFSVAVFLVIDRAVLTDEYDVWVAGVSVTTQNKDDVLGDGTVCYDPDLNMLIFDNANITTNGNAVHSANDLRIYLIGENNFVCENSDYISAISASNYHISKDIAIEGEGSLTVELKNMEAYAQGIVAENLVIDADVTVTMNDSEIVVNGIVCGSSLLLTSQADVTINNGVANYSAALRVRGNVLLEQDAKLNVSVSEGTVETCKGISINGDLVLGKNSVVNVSIDDEQANVGECLRVTGLLELGIDATLSASAAKTYGIECLGSMKLNDGATLTAQSETEAVDVLCYGALLNCGATVEADVNAFGGVHSDAQD